MVLKMNNDLGRMADEAVNISECALFLIDKPEVKPLIDIPRMAEEAAQILKESFKSLINEDIQLAHKVCERDDIVDGLRDQIFRELIDNKNSLFVGCSIGKLSLYVNHKMPA